MNGVLVAVLALTMAIKIFTYVTKVKDIECNLDYIC